MGRTNSLKILFISQKIKSTAKTRNDNNVEILSTVHGIAYYTAGIVETVLCGVVGLEPANDGACDPCNDAIVPI